MGLRMQPRSEKFFTLISKTGPNVVESAAGRRFVRVRRNGDGATQDYSQDGREVPEGS